VAVVTSIFSDNIQPPIGADRANRCPGRSRIVAFVPITIAVIGFAAILVGRVTVSEIAATDFLGGVDPVVTGSTKAVSDFEFDGKSSAR